ncbi:MAG TPA: c-type cytochrome [Candidatus Acidoferrales bacterium]|nr:c-type cytochrome [Candidatus Acidoferrales bacterium]
MRIRLLVYAALALSTVMCGCANAPGKEAAAGTPIVPGEISDFNVLYNENCAGCHGSEGRGGAAIALGDPVYLAIADDTIVRRAATNGIPGTSMPAFAQSAGGMLTEKQIDVIARGIRERWSKPNVLSGANPPPYSSTSPGDSSRGSQVYATFCSSCHGAAGKGGQKASSIVDGSFLALLNDQELRTIVIVGRPDLGAPDWRKNVPGTSMSAQDVSDVVAWLASQRSKFPGQPYPSTPKSLGEGR